MVEYVINRIMIIIYIYMQQVSLEVLEQVSKRCHVSADCKDIFTLLQTPHLQVIIITVFFLSLLFLTLESYILSIHIFF